MVVECLLSLLWLVDELGLSPVAPSAAAAALNEQALIDRIITAIAAKTAPDSAAPVNAAVQSAEVEFNGVVYVPKV